MSDNEGCSAVPTDRWKGQLDFDRPCGAVSSDETCWLCEDICAWNRAMHGLAYELVETRPRTLLLRYMTNVEVERDPPTAAREVSFLVSWLMSHHPCIQELEVKCAVRADDPSSRPYFPIHIRHESPAQPCRRLRFLDITESSSAHLNLEDMDAIVGLETLFIDAGETNKYFTAKIEALLERNHESLKRVSICEHSPKRREGLRLLESLVACEWITLKSPHNKSKMPDMDSVVTLMRTSTNLKEVTVQPILQGEVPVIARALESNLTLTKVSLYVETRGSIEELFRALQMNKHLSELGLYSCVFVKSSCMRAIASALENNDTLKALYMGSVFLDNCQGVGQWSEALSKNNTLQFLRIYCGNFSMNDISVFCKALQVNKSLKTLMLPGVIGSQEERTSLAQQLLADDCYDRVELGPWSEAFLKVLLPVLASSPRSPEQIWLPDIGELSRDTVSTFCSALASNKKIRNVTVDVNGEPDARVALLCSALAKNRFIQVLCVHIENGESAKEILRALALNTALSELEITLRVASDEDTAAAFSDMLSSNNAMTSISVCLNVDHPRLFVDAIAQGISNNRRIVTLGCWTRGESSVPSIVLESVRRNKCALNRAMEFVLQRREDKHTAECFELFLGRPCLTASLTETTGMSDVQARVEVASAKLRLREKYFVLTGVVRRSVVCWPADGTQIEALNPDCWRAIASYLSVSDICFP
ncbi:hypothetical protein HPB50_024587 [Hyalomma asiaticum]|uniref:Uncharacterized protein n=1 Tax=Hyalomma asiaticum TaxID=266040 RepID=A0ACB7RQ38_HYAAI|nr:hypothetical protein HPB50_024587 [Hyalomma asiaticum]